MNVQMGVGPAGLGAALLTPAPAAESARPRQLAPWRPDCLMPAVVATPLWKASRGGALLFSAAPLGPVVAPVPLSGLGAAPLLRSGCSKPAEDGLLGAAQAPRGGGRAPSGVSRHLVPSLSVESPQLPSTRKTPPSLSPLGPAEQGCTPLLSPVLSDAGGAGMDDQEEPRHKTGLLIPFTFLAPVGSKLAIHELLLTALLLASPWHLQYYCDLSGDVAVVVSERLSGHLHPPRGEELVSGLSGKPGRKPSPAARQLSVLPASTPPAPFVLLCALLPGWVTSPVPVGTVDTGGSALNPPPGGRAAGERAGTEQDQVSARDKTQSPAPVGMRPVLRWERSAALPAPEGPVTADWPCAPADEAYFIAKEILATERTYLKDLEVITVWFRSAVVKADAMPADLMTLLFSNIDPIYEFHRGFLREVEQRLALWEGSSSAQATGDHRRIGDVLLSNMLQLKTLTRHFQRLHEVLTELEAASRRLRRLEALRRDFELQKVCYLPLNAFLLKPLQRLRHYRLLLRRLCAPDRQDPGRGDQDRADRREALKAITEVTSTLQHSLARLENLQKLMELQRDLVGIENLIAPGREFIREGCLHKLTRKGLQQRMFFLFSDMLLYTSRGASGTSHFRIRGLLPLRGMLVEERENEWSVPHCFTIYAAQKTVVLAASTRLEKEKWMRDLNAAIDAAKSSADTALAPLGSVLCPLPRRPSDEVSLEELEDDARGARCSSGGPGQHRASTAMHVCWDRTTSISRADRSAAVENQLSGYLLRKFKNSNGWQKLWVVFTNFCLFFYKTHQDDCPLASLPLLGYSVSLPGEADGIHKEHVFKLQFKSHIYFFRAESKYTFGRWMEVIESASTSPGRAGTPEEEA
ncbi:hypothetical protein J1605_010961 [Eschrichtius robustus]|uniref:FERM, RhoGEF and pleckstrin domain-containing protein 2 n=1 Tax=Eschrichtius robustus TaxID=9764 RepID=A0AB34GR28_ESCRO|nr:hypothetical protein J1605_010961 [Eschrichtius robustus]